MVAIWLRSPHSARKVSVNAFTNTGLSTVVTARSSMPRALLLPAWRGRGGGQGGSGLAAAARGTAAVQGPGGRAEDPRQLSRPRMR